MTSHAEGEVEPGQAHALPLRADATRAVEAPDAWIDDARLLASRTLHAKQRCVAFALTAEGATEAFIGEPHFGKGRA